MTREDGKERQETVMNAKRCKKNTKRCEKMRKGLKRLKRMKNLKKFKSAYKKSDMLSNSYKKSVPGSIKEEEALKNR